MTTRSRTATRARTATAGANGQGQPQTTIMLVKDTDIQQLLWPQGGRRQSLQGFDDHYVDIVHYIVSCTHRIWDELGVGLIYSHYLHNAKMHVGDGWFMGRDKVIADTIQTLSAFSDRRPYADAVVWTGDDQQGFYTSHLVYSLQHHTGHSVFGPPTGRKVMRMALALCYVKANLICEEWLMHDELGVIRQLGLDVEETVARFARRDATRPLHNYGDVERVYGQTVPETYPPKKTDGFNVDDFVRRNLHDIWNWRMFNRIRDCYHPDYQFHGSNQRELYGRGDYVAFVLSLLAAFPEARFSIDQLYWNGDGENGYRTSMRWSLIGSHDGDGIFGEPTGTHFRIWGLTQHVIKDGRFVEEWTLFNEFSVLKRLYLARQAQVKA